MYPAADNAIALERSQGLRQHLLRDPSNHPLELAVAPDTEAQGVDDQHGPAIGEQRQHLAGIAARVEDVWLKLRHGVPDYAIDRAEAARLGNEPIRGETQ